MKFDCIVVGSHLRFDGVWQRPQQIASRLARRTPVLFVEEPFAGEIDRDELREASGVTVLRPTRRHPAGLEPDDATLAAVAGWLGDRCALVWLYTPMMLALAGLARTGTLVYDCMDELAAFDFAPPQLHEREALLVARAQRVFAGGRSLFEARRGLGERVRLFPSGVEFDHFARARNLPRHPLFAALEAPVYGYVGVIDERIDFEIVAALAVRPVNVALIGPIVKIDPVTLPRRANVHFTGHMPYAELPALLAGIDVAIMPFARKRATAFISPTKTPEYLAAGKAVVSTPIADVVADYGDVVAIAATPDAFADACLTAAQPDPAARARGAERAAGVSWDGIVARMWADLERE